MRKFYLFTVIILGNALLWAEILVLGQNNFVNNPHWTAQKAMSVGEVVNLSRSIMAGYRMNFGDMHGYQQITSRHERALDRLSFSFSMFKDSYLDVLYAPASGAHWGLRLSANEVYPGAIYRVDEKGRFLQYQKNSALQISSGHHQVSIEEKEGILNIIIDKAIGSRIPGSILNPQVSFRGGRRDIWMEKVEAFHLDKEIWHEGFRSSWVWSRVFPFCLLFSCMLIGFSFKRYPKLAGRLLILGGIWFCFDFFYFSHLPIGLFRGRVSSVQPTLSYINFESLREDFFTQVLTLFGLGTSRRSVPSPEIKNPMNVPDLIWCDASGCHRIAYQAAKQKFAKKGKNELRILLMGGSFYAGVGVMDLDDMAFRYICRGLEQASGKRHVIGLDIARTAESTQKQERRFFQAYISFAPDVLLVGGTAYYREHFPDSILRLKKYADKKGIPFLYLKAPRNPEYAADLARREEVFFDPTVPNLDLSIESLNPLTSEGGFIWWDEAHMTDYGNNRIGDFVASQLRVLLSKKDAN